MDESAYVTKDSGQREEFATGSQRDSRDGKGRFDLLPANVFSYLDSIAVGNLNLDHGRPGCHSVERAFEVFAVEVDGLLLRHGPGVKGDVESPEVVRVVLPHDGAV